MKFMWEKLKYLKFLSKVVWYIPTNVIFLTVNEKLLNEKALASNLTVTVYKQGLNPVTYLNVWPR